MVVLTGEGRDRVTGMLKVPAFSLTDSVPVLNWAVSVMVAVAVAVRMVAGVFTATNTDEEYCVERIMSGLPSPFTSANATPFGVVMVNACGTENEGVLAPGVVVLSTCNIFALLLLNMSSV